MRLVVLLSAYLIFLFGCSKDATTEINVAPAGCDSMAFSYHLHIAPIIQSNCNLPDCHATGGAGSYDYTTYAVVADRIRTGRFVDRLNLVVDDSQHMPIGIQMNPCEKYKLLTWIQQGFPDN